MAGSDTAGPSKYYGIVTADPYIIDIIEKIEKIASTKCTVMISGESGTGKELFARAIHAASDRRNKPFITVNCSAIPATLLESELFGHKKGSFTGATADKPGLFEEANGGTLFLDEIGEIPLELQPKLLRAIQEEEIRRIGASDTIKLNIRIITATNKNLEDEVEARRFREDLYYRLNVFKIEVPPLRERRNDVPLLVDHFMNKFCEENNLRTKHVSGEAMGMLRNYHWKGNVREFENVIEQTVVLMGDKEIIREEDLPSFLEQRRDGRKKRFLHDALKEQLSIEDYTKRFIETFQDEYSEKKLAEKLGITPKTLWEKRKKWGIEREK